MLIQKFSKLNVEILPYKSEFYDACMNVFRSNIPTYFDADEEPEFAEYLAEEIKDYFVLLVNDELRGCGGYFVNVAKKAAGLDWGMIHREVHKKGYGTDLLTYRLHRIQTDYPYVTVYLDTSQHTYEFYERFGFEVETITKDGYGDGLDQYDMALKPVVVTSP